MTRFLMILTVARTYKSKEANHYKLVPVEQNETSIYPQRQLRENNRAHTARKRPMFFIASLGNKDNNEPLIPNPSKAKLTTMKAK